MVSGPVMDGWNRNEYTIHISQEAWEDGQAFRALLAQQQEYMLHEFLEMDKDRTDGPRYGPSYRHVIERRQQEHRDARGKRLVEQLRGRGRVAWRAQR